MPSPIAMVSSAQLPVVGGGGGAGARYIRIIASTTQGDYGSASGFEIRDGSGTPLTIVGITGNSYFPGYEIENTIDSDPDNIWHTDFASGPFPPPPHTVTFDLGTNVDAQRLMYLPRQSGGNNGDFYDYVIEWCADGESTWTECYSGNFATDNGLDEFTRSAIVIDFGPVG